MPATPPRPDRPRGPAFPPNAAPPSFRPAAPARLAAALLCAAVLAGCGDTQVADRKATGGAVPEGPVIVTRLATPKDGDTAILLSGASERVGGQVAADLAARHVEIAHKLPKKPDPDALILRVSALRAQKGNALERTAIGFGAGRASIVVRADLIHADAPRGKPILTFVTTAGTGHMPGMLLPVGVGVATANIARAALGATMVVVRTSAGTPSMQETRAAKGIAREVAAYLKGKPV